MWWSHGGKVKWTAFASGLSNATGSLTGHAALLTKVAFPREILPIACVVAAMPDAAIASPVVYPLSLARGRLSPAACTAYILNPIAGIIDTFRRGVVLHATPDAPALVAASLVVLLLLRCAYIDFKHAERTMADAV